MYVWLSITQSVFLSFSPCFTLSRSSHTHTHTHTHTLTNQSLKSLSQIRGSMSGEELIKELHHTNRKAWGCLCYGVGAFVICKVGNLHQVKGKSDRLTAYCSITWSHLKRYLCVKDLYSCKIMTQSILANSALKQRTASPSTDVLVDTISRLKCHWTGVEWSWPKSRSKTTCNCSILLVTLAGELDTIIFGPPPVFGEKNAKIMRSCDNNQNGSFIWI